MLSVVIPARNEIYLEPTIRDILEKSRGEIEVIAVLDGYLPDEPIDIKDDRVTFLHYETSIGQRQAINEAAKRAKGKYILKTDAHSMFDEGFDIKLAEDCEPDWTVIPRMYNMDVSSWKPKTRKRTDYMWIRSYKAKDKPFRHNYFRDGSTFQRVYPDHWKNFKKWNKDRPLIDDVMTGQGACFFMELDRFWELEGMDTGHGQWGQMGVELACKAWLSGGRQVVNKKTWFSHYFRGGGGPGFPWPHDNKSQDWARDYSIGLWSNDKWPKQKRPLSWLVEKFNCQVAPLTLPTWNGEEMVSEKMKKKMSNKIIIPYEDPRNPQPYTQKYARQHCKEPVGEIPPGSIRPSPNPDVPWFALTRKFGVRSTYKNLLRYTNPLKLDGAQWVSETIDPFIKRIIKGETFTDDQLKELPYYEYLVSRLNPVVNPPEGPNHKGVKHAMKKMKDLVNLVYSMKDNGMQSPLDFYVDSVLENGKYRIIIKRGTRRLRIAYFLGWEFVTGRIWKTKHLAETFIQTADWPEGEGIITKLAAEQFAKYGRRATDKYYKHNYTYIYDRKFFECKKDSILELGVQGGASVKLWQDAYPNAKVCGIDKRIKIDGRFEDKRIKLYEGNYTDVKFLTKVAEEQGPFNLIIDDCSHLPHEQKIAFETLWPYLKSNRNRGAIYVIEDFYHNYMAKYKDDNMLSIVKGFIDKLYLTNEIKEISFHAGVVIITKA